MIRKRFEQKKVKEKTFFKTFRSFAALVVAIIAVFSAVAITGCKQILENGEDIFSQVSSASIDENEESIGQQSEDKGSQSAEQSSEHDPGGIQFGTASNGGYFPAN